MSSEENSDDRPITVGVIDDDPMICQAMRLILEDYSTGRLNVVFTCTDGGQAVDEAGRHHPDVVLMDVAMPGMDGIEATRRLRALPQPPHVLILTSLSPSGTVERAVEAGAEGFVSKTDAPEDIIRRITDVCDGLPQFNPSSQRQLINDLNMQQPQSRRDEARKTEEIRKQAAGALDEAHISSAGDRLCMGRVQMARLVERADLPDQL